MWDPRHLTTLWASTACYRDNFSLLTPSPKTASTTAYCNLTRLCRSTYYRHLRHNLVHWLLTRHIHALLEKTVFYECLKFNPLSWYRHSTYSVKHCKDATTIQYTYTWFPYWKGSSNIIQYSQAGRPSSYITSYTPDIAFLRSSGSSPTWPGQWNKFEQQLARVKLHDFQV
jgi:hypothetical protein